MLLAEFSHVLAFSMLFISSIFDVMSDKGDVPDFFGIAAIGGGILIHAILALQVSSLQPLLYCLGVGLAFSAYGWLAYWRGMWGGADALGLSVLGFGAPFLTLSMTGVVQHSLNMLVNIVLVSGAYTMVFASLRAYRTEEFTEKLVEKFREEWIGVLLGVVAGALFFFSFKFSHAVLFYSVLLLMVFLFVFLKAVEEHGMTETIPAEKLEGGEVLADGKIEGVSEEEIEDLEDEVEIMHGMRFMPVFPIALVLTDAGLSLIPIIVGL